MDLPNLKDRTYYIIALNYIPATVVGSIQTSTSLDAIRQNEVERGLSARPISKVPTCRAQASCAHQFVVKPTTRRVMRSERKQVRGVLGCSRAPHTIQRTRPPVDRKNCPHRAACVGSTQSLRCLFARRPIYEGCPRPRCSRCCSRPKRAATSIIKSGKTRNSRVHLWLRRAWCRGCRKRCSLCRAPCRVRASSSLRQRARCG